MEVKDTGKMRGKKKISMLHADNTWRESEKVHNKLGRHSRILVKAYNLRRCGVQPLRNNSDIRLKSSLPQTLSTQRK